MTTVYFAGGEDSELRQVGGGTVVTTGGRFRASYGRCALQVGNVQGFGWWENQAPFAASLFWATARVYNGVLGYSVGAKLLWFADATGNERLSIRVAGSASWGVFKVNTAGVATQLGANFAWLPSAAAIDKLDVYWDNQAAGTILVYSNGALLFTYSGDTTTEVTTMAYIRLGTTHNSTNALHLWSEIIVADVDTRALSLQTLAPVANGNTHNFDTGTPAAANVNEVTLSDATLDGSTTAGQRDQYTIPAIAAGTSDILAFGVSARMTKGATGPSKADLNVRVSGADYDSSDVTLSSAWEDFQNWWTSNPAGGAWAGLPTNIGIKSVT